MALSRPRRARPDERLSVVEHLTELRTRLVWSFAALVIAFVAMYIIRDPLLDLLESPLPERYRETGLITLSPTEPFFTVLKVCFWSALLVSIPVWLYQLYAFVIPAVKDQSRRVTMTIVAGISGLFLAGVAFGFFVVLPVALDFLLGFGGDHFQQEVRAQEYFGFVTTLLLGAGLMFEVPAAMVGFARLGVVSADMYLRQWRVAIVVIAAIAAILPGGDPFSMLLLMIPQVVLYGVGVALARRFGRPVLWQADPEPEADPDPDPDAGPGRPSASAG